MASPLEKHQLHYPSAGWEIFLPLSRRKCVFSGCYYLVDKGERNIELHLCHRRNELQFSVPLVLPALHSPCKVQGPLCPKQWEKGRILLGFMDLKMWRRKDWGQDVTLCKPLHPNTSLPTAKLLSKLSVPKIPLFLLFQGISSTSGHPTPKVMTQMPHMHEKNSYFKLCFH